MDLRQHILKAVYSTLLFMLIGCSSNDSDIPITDSVDNISPLDRLFTVSRWRVSGFRTTNEVLFDSEFVRPTTLTFLPESQIVEIDVDCSDRSGPYDVTGGFLLIQDRITRLNTCAVSSEIHNLEVQTIE